MGSKVIRKNYYMYMYLCYLRVKVVHDHNHHCCSLLDVAWVVLDGVGPAIKESVM